MLRPGLCSRQSDDGSAEWTLPRTRSGCSELGLGEAITLARDGERVRQMGGEGAWAFGEAADERLALDIQAGPPARRTSRR
jgi:hypothetical protein